MQERLSACNEQGIEFQSESLFQNFLIAPFLRLPLIMLYSLFTILYTPAEEDKSPIAPPKPPSWAVWYISNSAGMAISPAPSRIAALRSKNCLALAIVDVESLPSTLTPYYRSSLKIDFRMLFENGKPIREQWVFRDEKSNGLVVAVAVIQPSVAPAVAFVECYNENGFIEEERLFDDKETQIKYFYKGRILARTETHIWEKIEKPREDAALESEPAAVETESETLEAEAADESLEAETEAPLEPEFETVETTVYTDYYRYSVSDSLRAVERVFQKGKPEAGRFVVAFPSMKLRQEIDSNFVKTASTNRSGFLAGAEASNALYTVDGRGRVLSETQRDESGGILVETKNTWTGGRISVVEQRLFEKPQDADAEESPEIDEDKPEKRGKVVEERRVEYEYNSDGDRVLEKNYNNGALERTVRKSGNQEIEEIYLDGKIVLRAVWEGNRKIKEERVK